MTTLHKNLAFVFPGQGSQSVGMLSQLAANYPEVKHVFDKASFILGRDLWGLVCNGPEAELNQTQNTQPAMLVAGVAAWEVWCKNTQVRPAWMAGHSLGEYTALVCSGALFFEDAVKLVEARAHSMQEAVAEGQGAMAAILGLDDDQVIEICGQVAEADVVAAVNFNAPGQVVIAGHRSAVDRAMTAAKAAGAKRALLLPVSVPSHCLLMKPAAERLGEWLENTPFAEPKMKLVNNVDVATYSSPDVIRAALKEQLYKPVRWVETVSLMHGMGVNCFVECGPGKVLTGLGKRIVKEAEHIAIYDPETLTKALEIK
jgi:[acyl-carrier-protein] S-malonyltransferase